ncbi:hypothetical protein E1A91_D06G216600v1 [Gossypium mustelinum]|uniref:Inositol polyphosphate-related phosphatase domain-containing protein n=1 Tax=Gossypium mustelinum TaxID=34275 RepID=A0A5D2UNR4_GOSMU|nr:hypothetical protein E1A91_D06G216600v1 [Gossypium mustelinum]TYI78496.1 hypothetical protein E1A91_D06G216600v1 [Gossypium mustelinum]
MIGVGFSGITLMNQDRTNQQASSLIGKILSVKGRNQSNKEIEVRFGSSEEQYDLPHQPLLSREKSTKAASENISFCVFVATWNVGGKSPDSKLNLDDILQVREESDIYVLGFQEIVPLNAGNVLVIEDNEPAVKWLTLINRSLNKANYVPLRGPRSVGSPEGSLVFPKIKLRKASKALRTENKRKLKSCNCPIGLERKNSKEFCFRCPQSQTNENDISSEDDEDGPNGPSSANSIKYSLVASKQMVGIFLTVWMRKELVQYVSHLRISCVGRGILGCLGNKGCISVSMLFHKTTLCFLCSHLASGEKEGDELRRNSDVIEILRNTQFPRICKTLNSRVPEKILDHDRVIWLGDLNYRIALSYSDTGKLLKERAWDTLYNNDQLKIEREAGRVFKGWKEGKIYFAPTYKYSLNSDIYAGETVETKSKRRTPAWCDRILWRGSEIYQLSYERKESRFSDHRPVCATFWVSVEAMEDGSKRR